MIDWLEAQYPDPPVIPKDPVLRFMSKLVEDYADEWCWRAALYWRWQPIESRKLLMRRIGREVLDDFPAPNWLAGWYFGRRQIATYLKGDGLSTETEPHIKQHYLDLLDAMSALLEDQPYLLGSHPTLVDIGLFGPMFRHYAQDPTPSRVMEERAPAVYAWVGRVWNARAHRLGREPIPSDFSHPGWEYFVRDIVQNYWPFLLRTARAWAAGKPRVDHEAHGVTYKNLKVVHYRVYCLEVLQNEYRSLSEPNRKTVDALLRPYGTLELIDGLDSGLMQEHQLPLRPDRVQPSKLQRFKLALMGTPWDMPAKPTERERP
jgi:glutathione S-transferase